MKVALVLIAAFFSQAVFASGTYPKPFFPSTAQQQARVVEVVDKLMSQTDSDRALKRPFTFAGKTKYALNRTMLEGCKAEGNSENECRQWAVVPSLKGTLSMKTNEFSIDLNSKETFVVCAAMLYQGTEDGAAEQLELIQELFDPNVKKAPFVVGSCTCNPTSVDEVGGDSCGLFGYQSDAKGN